MAAVGALVLSAGVAAQPAPSQPNAAGSGQTEAYATLMRMATFVAGAHAFSVTIESSYDAVQDSGQEIEFGAVRHVLLARPDSLRIETDNRDGSRRAMLFDGKTLTFSSPDAKVYASIARPGDIDQAVQYVLDTLQTPVPLSMLLMTTLPQEMEQHFTSVAKVADETIDGRATTHIAARSADVDVEVWVAQGDQPAPLRTVITYKHAKDGPQFRASLRDWNFNPTVDAAAFKFVPPAGAFAVGFMVPVPAETLKTRTRR
ncbi:MAG: DUF2092 domain-containing protein [Proteobacteria bacterium]|nr:DUF2092 domain-containing protein [Pseudomonadota bacterium]